MYARQVDDRTLTFAVSGKLWEASLVMVDEETGSLWSHILGEAMQGPLQGATLEILPSVMTDWKSWKEAHPKSTVVLLDRTSGDYRRDFYDSGGIELAYRLDEKHARVWSLDCLHSTPVVNDQVGEAPVAAFYDRDSCTAALYDRVLDGRELTFVQRDDGRVVDQQTESTWDIVTGGAVDGPLAGRRLRRLPAFLTDSAAWGLYHAHTTRYEVPEGLQPSDTQLPQTPAPARSAEAPEPADSTPPPSD